MAAISKVTSRLLKKSFEIIADTNKNSRIRREDLNDILNILKDQKKEKNRKAKIIFDSTTVSPEERRSFLGVAGRQKDGASALKSNFFVSTIENKEPVSKSNKPVDKAPRQMKKSCDKFDIHETDCGKQQQQLHKVRNAKIVGAMLFLGVLLIVIIALGISS